MRVVEIYESPDRKAGCEEVKSLLLEEGIIRLLFQKLMKQNDLKESRKFIKVFELKKLFSKFSYLWGSGPFVSTLSEI